MKPFLLVGVAAFLFNFAALAGVGVNQDCPDCQLKQQGIVTVAESGYGILSANGTSSDHELEVALQDLNKAITFKQYKAQNTTMSTLGYPDVQISVVSGKDLIEMFKQMAGDKKIPFRYPEDGCYARAEEMARLLEKQGVLTAKIFVEGNLRVETKNAPDGYVSWWYHVAPVVLVKNAKGELVPMVIDPSLFDKPVTADEWVRLQTSHTPQKPKVYYKVRFAYTPYSNPSSTQGGYYESDLWDMVNTMKTYKEYQDARHGTGTSGSIEFLFGIQSAYAADLGIMTFTDKVRSVDEEKDRYRVTFQKHAAIYHVLKKDPGSKETVASLKKALEKNRPVQVESDPNTMVIKRAEFPERQK